MPARDQSWSPETFDRLYAADPDPWRFATSQYEREKYAATLAALGNRRFVAALEVGCSIGVFTRLLAPRCRTLLAVDVAEAALAAARRRCAGLPGVRIERRRIPDEWPEGGFDLIVLSEVLYFLGSADIARTARCVATALHPGGLALLVNWTGATDTPCTGDEAAELFIAAAAPELRSSQRVTGATYRLDLLSQMSTQESVS
jgi:cyclopropane fatty-acyl-phospholipid synthase-like methyltransferase